MGKLIYSVIGSLDGYVADEDGKFDWFAPDNEVLAFINDFERSVGTYLYGRRAYELMTCWETDPTLAEESPAMRDFAEMWQAADKVVYSRTLEEVSTKRTRIEQEFDPDAVRQLKANTERDLTVFGPNLAASALRAGVVDECHLYLTPILVGGGKPIFPDHVWLQLELTTERRFGNGVVFLTYRAKPAS